MGWCYGVMELSSTRQTVVISGVESEALECDIGVPQGTVLGPTLSNLYIKDMYGCFL